MTLYRTGLDRFKKWEKKYVPDTIGARFAQVADVAKERAQAGLIEYGELENIVRPILEKYGITGPDRAKYLAFARKLRKHAERHKSAALVKIAQGLKTYFVQAYGCDPVVLDEIINAVAATVIAY